MDVWARAEANPANKLTVSELQGIVESVKLL